jgi:putative intracellular protease/amidase
MKMSHVFSVLVVWGVFFLGSCAVQAKPANACTYKALVVTSSVGYITLTNATRSWNQTVGFYLDEWYYPTSALIRGGWNVTVANPLGNQPPLDPNSNSSSYFLDEQDYQDALALLAQQTATKEEGTLGHPRLLSTFTPADLADIDVVFIPGGHPPMVDLYKDADLGNILSYFHSNKKPTAAICHGPVALLSAQLVTDVWPYRSYNMTVFPTAAELMMESLWGGDLPFIPEAVLSAFGGIIDNWEGPQTCWEPHVVIHNELLTGMNPASAPSLAANLTNYLAAYCNSF